ncbi:MAG: ATP-binding protein, partial [Anaerolineae bacterium]|nr:ATP-binding protein [Anaerolineae bacterium]
SADDRLIAFGNHVYEGGYLAMRQLLETRIPFTAVLASNDESAFGALRALQEAGARVPADIAIIGFDDRPESPLQKPTLTTVHIPLFKMGYQAVALLAQHLDEGRPLPNLVRVPTRLVIRESCGCGHSAVMAEALGFPAAGGADLSALALQPHLAEQITAQIMEETHGLTRAEVARLCQQLVEAFLNSISENDPAHFRQTLDDVLRRVAAAGDDPHQWQAAITVLRRALPQIAAGRSEPEAVTLADALLDEARIAVSAAMRVQHWDYAHIQRQTDNQVGMLTARLLKALDEAQIYDILARYLPEMDLRTAWVAFYEAEGDDPVAWSRIRAVTSPGQPVVRMPSRAFPPAQWLADLPRPFHLALVPLVGHDTEIGFVAFEATHLELLGAIVQQVSAALNTARLYRAATEGRRLAEEANQIKSRFLSTVSHELRTPLNLIVGLGEILLRDSERGTVPLPPEARHDLERLNANAQHLGRLIGDVLDLASSEAGQLRLANQLLDLGQVLRTAAETGRRLAADKGLEWHADLPEAGPWVWGDRTRLLQVTLNLISNAIKFTARGEVRLGVEVGEGTVTVSVRDTGLGIPPEEQASIFSDFRRSERSIARGYGGLGLGLAICRRLIELHGGTIGVHSTGQEGAGSTFYFTLPTVEPPAAQTSGDVSPAAAAVPGDGGVLVLTASPDASERLRQHLQQRGFEVQMSLIDQPASWQPLLLSAPPAAVVLDVTLAADRAWHVLKMLKADPMTQSIPVLFYALSQDNAAVLELDYLNKPIELAELTRALDQQWLLGDAEPRPEAQRVFLVVDDDPDTLEMHARIVQRHSPSHRVLKARNGLEALDILQRERVDLVLLDLMMPEMDGFAVLETMRSREATRRIPVIVITGQTLTEAEMERLNIGVTRVLSKGVFNLEETLAHLDAALARKRALSGEAQRLVRQAMAYIQENYAEPLSREQIAAHVGLSDDYLTSCFRKELGLTPMAYLNRYRIQQARQLLKNTHKSITEIALDVGFSSSSYFSRIFRRETGMSPEAYRRL